VSKHHSNPSHDTDIQYRFIIRDLPTRLFDNTAAEGIFRAGSLFDTTFVEPGFKLYNTLQHTVNALNETDNSHEINYRYTTILSM